VSLQYSTTLRNTQLNQVQSTVSSGGLFRLYTGSVPANCAASATGTKLVEIDLPNTFMNSASSGSATLAGTWSASAVASGTAGYFRIYDASGNCYAQGVVTQTGGGGDMTLDNTNIASNQTVTVNTFTLTAGNA
jgi:hypothetical protein